MGNVQGWGLLGIPSESQRVLETGILILRLRDGLVHELWSEMGDLQLGALPRAEQGEGEGAGS